jgi:hypothetical protein
MPISQELIFTATRMDQEHIGIASFPQGQRLPRAYGDHIHAGVMFRLKSRQDGF